MTSAIAPPPETQATSPTGEAARDVVCSTAGWIDLVKADETTIAAVESRTGLDLPTLAQLSEVEASSRLRRQGTALYLSLPLVFRDENGRAKITPVGFVLSRDHLVTIRFETLKAFATCQARVERDAIDQPCAATTFLALIEAIVDRLADVLEEVAAELDAVANEVFAGEGEPKRRHAPKAQGQNLHRSLRRLGRARTLASKVRTTLLGIGRMVPFVQSEAEDWLPKEALHRFQTILHDVESLDEFEVHLSDKVQFLLDADLGFINIEQNNVFRVLTVVSVVGIPPTLVASMYGMNFKHMPELDWVYGYPYGIAVIAISAIVPLLFFRVKGWF